MATVPNELAAASHHGPNTVPINAHVAAMAFKSAEVLVHRPITPRSLSDPSGSVQGMTAFPGGTTVIERWENHLLCDALGVEPLPDGLAHPAFLFHASLRGVDLTIKEMLAIGKPESEDAVRAGGYRWTLHQPLKVDTPYRCTGEVTKFERKEGRRAGVMDLMTIRIELTKDQEPVATADTTCVFLR